MVEAYECSECDETLVATEGRILGVLMAVHLHDEHDEKFAKLAEDARGQIDATRDMLDDT